LSRIERIGVMLKLAGKGMRDGQPVRLVVLGLSHQNLVRLKAGQPIHFRGEDVEIEGVDFLIYSGQTEQTMARELSDLVGPRTQTRIDPQFKD
jgi:hypothetical protein